MSDDTLDPEALRNELVDVMARAIWATSEVFIAEQAHAEATRALDALLDKLAERSVEWDDLAMRSADAVFYSPSQFIIALRESAPSGEGG